MSAGLVALFGPTLTTKDGDKPTEEVLAGKTAVGIYFSAHWCPPCRGFTPQLAKWYTEGLKDTMEIVFCSSDQDQAQFDGYAAEMPWPSLPYAKRAEKELLSTAMGVEGIPSFAVINPDGTIVTTDGRAKVTNDPTGANFPDGWLPQPFNSVDATTDGLNEEKCVVAMGESAALQVAVSEAAQDVFAAAGKDVDSMPYRFFSADTGGISDQIRKLTGQSGNALVMLDIPDNGSFYASAADVSAFTKEQVQAFISDVAAGKVEKQSFAK
jgi:nucleoredoxin